MKIMNLDTFIKRFKSDNISFDAFCSKAKVRINENLEELESYKKRKKLSKNDIYVLYLVIKERNTYLENFYNTSLEIKHSYGDLSFENPMKKGELSNNQNINYKNLIRNLHFEEILGNTSSGFTNIPSYLTVLDEYEEQQYEMS